MRVLDRNRSFGTVHPAGRAVYEQDGVLFDADGNELDAPRKPGRPPKVQEPPQDEPGGAEAQ